MSSEDSPRASEPHQDVADDTPPPPPQMGHSEAQWEYYPAFDLSDVQFRAIEFTVQGLRDTQIAEILSIDRKTLWRWKTQDEEYIRALEDARRQLYSAVADRYRTLLLRATAVMARFLEDSSDTNRFRAAYGLLMMAGCFKPPPPVALPDFDDAPQLTAKVG